MSLVDFIRSESVETLKRIEKEVEDITNRLGKLPARVAGVEPYLKADELKKALKVSIRELENEASNRS